MKLLYLLHRDGLNGNCLNMFHQANALDKSRFIPSFCFLREPTEFKEKIIEKGYPVTYLNFGRRSIFSASAQLLKLMRQEKFDIILSFGKTVSFMGRFLAKWSGCGHFLQGISTIGKKSDLTYRYLEKMTSGLVSMYLCNTERAAIDLSLIYAIPKEKISTVYFGIDLKPFLNAKRHAPINALKTNSSWPVITMVANLAAYKGHIYLLGAVRKLRGKQNNFYVWLVGGDSWKNQESMAYREQLENIISRNGFGNVRFLGFRSDIPQILKSTDIFVLPSLREGLPTVIVEAMAAGVPVVVTDVGGIRELIQDGKTGLIVPPKNENALAEKIESLLKDNGLRNQIGKAGQRWVLDHFSIEENISRFMKIYEDSEVLANRHTKNTTFVSA